MSKLILHMSPNTRYIIAKHIQGSQHCFQYVQHIYMYLKMSQFARMIVFSVSFASTCRSQTYPFIVIDLLCGKYRHMTFIDVRRSLCKNANVRRYIDLLYYLRKYMYSHILRWKLTVV